MTTQFECIVCNVEFIYPDHPHFRARGYRCPICLTLECDELDRKLTLVKSQRDRLLEAITIKSMVVVGQV